MQMRLLIMRCNDSCQHCTNEVQRTYILQHKCIHHRCKTIRIEQNQIESRPQSSHPSIGVCFNRNQSQIRIEFDPASRPATRALLPRCQPCPMCSSRFQLASRRCRVPVVAFVQQQDHTDKIKKRDAGAGATRATKTRYQSVNSAITRKNCCKDQQGQFQ